MMTPETLYKISSYGDFAQVDVSTTSKRLVNRICKHLAKYGRNQQTTITTVKQTVRTLKTKKTV